MDSVSAKPSKAQPTKNETYKIKSDVIYLPDAQRIEKGDLYLPKNSKGKNLPAMVVIHGGGFEKNDKGDAREQTAGKLLA
jgi:acetyl esterase/lipase